MDPTSGPDLGPVLTALARTAVASSFGPRPPRARELLADAPPALGERAATFVTLERDGTLRGCIGTLTALRPLGFDVVRNARLAARDPRLPPVAADEVPGLTVKVAVLTPSEPVPVRDFAALIDGLRPGEDGLTLKDADHRATFLPSVWATAPDPQRFVAALLRKGGWPRRYWTSGDPRSAPWPEGLEAERYGTVDYVGMP